jgi:hypothetical protein
VAINAGYWDIHIYVQWDKTHNMSEITPLTHDDDRDEIRHGPVLRFDKKNWRRAAS